MNDAAPPHTFCGMRALLIAVLLSVSPVAAAEQRDPLLDDYFACLVGQGVVEMHYGGSVEDAYAAAIVRCIKTEQAALKGNEDPGVLQTIKDTAEKVFISITQQNGV